MTYTKDIYFSWDDIQSLCRDLAVKIHASHPKIDKIIAITRGGLFPAGIIARELNIRNVETVGVVLYNGKTRNETPEIIKPPAVDFMKNALVLDDLSDTGATIKHLRNTLEGAVYATILVKPEGAGQVDFYVREVAQDTWVRFPWDTVRQYAAPLIDD